MKSSSVTIQVKGTAVVFSCITVYYVLQGGSFQVLNINLKDKILMCVYSNINKFYTNYVQNITVTVQITPTIIKNSDQSPCSLRVLGSNKTGFLQSVDRVSY